MHDSGRPLFFSVRLINGPVASIGSIVMQSTLTLRHYRLTSASASPRRWAALLLIVLLCGEAACPSLGWSAQPVAPTLAREGDRTRFEVTTFATGLAYPTSMTTLADGSLLVAESQGGTTWIANDIWGSTRGSLVRLVDANQDGVADGAPQVLADYLPGIVSSVRRVDNTIFALSSQAGKETITILQPGSTPTAALTTIGTINFSFPTTPVQFEHTTYALAARAATTGGVDLYFNVGSQANSVGTAVTRTVGLSLGGSAAFAGSAATSAQMAADSIQAVHVNVAAGTMSVSAPYTIAVGLRNAAGMVFDDAGNLYFQDNGFDNGNTSLSADTLHVIAASSLGKTVPNFGFANTYIDYATGATVGPTDGVVPPLAAFRPVDGKKSEGAVELAFAPEMFPYEFWGEIFVPFSGKYGQGGLANDENPLVVVNPESGSLFHFIENQQMGHPNGLLATDDTLYLSDLNFWGGFGGTSDGTPTGIPADEGGVVYAIRVLPAYAVPEPATGVLIAAAAATWLTVGWRSGRGVARGIARGGKAPQKSPHDRREKSAKLASLPLKAVCGGYSSVG